MDLSFRKRMAVPHDLARVGALAEPTRRALYEYVASQPEARSREEAATAVGVPVHSAKFHLDRLVEEGLLEVEFRRLSGRTGPGAGRPSKLYRRSPAEVSVSIPPRQYDLVGDILAAAIERAARADTPVEESVDACARETGARLARAARATRATGLDRLAEALAPHGYEPRVEGREMLLANCPFDRLAREHTGLVCSMNLALVEGVVAALACREVQARLEPSPEHCCVRAHESTGASDAGSSPIAPERRSARRRT